MNQSDSPSETALDENLLNSLVGLDETTAQIHLRKWVKQRGNSIANAVSALASAALAAVEHEPQKASSWLQLAQSLEQNAADPTTSAQIAHAQARLYLREGALVAAEQALLQAQKIWQRLNDSVALARTYLGMTHVFTLQGKYTDAQMAASRAITLLEAAVSSTPTLIPLLVTALRNQGNVYGYTYNHRAALATYEHALQLIGSADNLPNDAEIESQLAYEAACIDLSRAVDLMAFARLQEAEQALRAAILYFERVGHRQYDSYARSNLASLYARTGQYAQALALYDQALQVLYGVGTSLDEMSPEELQATDVLLLDRAQVFLALNLRREAFYTLMLAERSFIHAQRPQELAQTLYARGVLQIQEEQWDAAAVSLAQAEAGFAALQIGYWQNRTKLARVALLQQQGKLDTALTLLASLIGDNPTALADQWYGWDLGTATELFLQQLQLALDRNDLQSAQRAASTVEEIFRLHFADVPPINVDTERLSDYVTEDEVTEDEVTEDEVKEDEVTEDEVTEDEVTEDEQVVAFGVPHLRFAYLYALGRIERAAGNLSLARHYFQQAVALLESQRASLPLEELRIAFLGGKNAVYTDWLLALIDDPDAGEQHIDHAFALVERARSRALLELLLAALDGQPTAEPEIDSVDTDNPNVSSQQQVVDGKERALAEQRTLVRRQLHWLYNKLLGQDNTRRLQPEQLQEIRNLEFRLEQLKPQQKLPIMARPVEVHDLQSVIQSDEHVLAYTIAGEEVLLFSVTATGVRLFRRLCALAEVRKAQRDLRFQMGRLRTDDVSLRSLDERAQRLLHQALHRLYQLLVAPVAQHLSEQRLRIIPYGLLHQLPFHAFWTGDQYLVEQFDCCYAPSAGVAVYQADRTRQPIPHPKWSGLAVTEQDIPETATEVRGIASFFPQARLYLDENASRAGLVTAAREADILHISTHGLMRNDNPLFSSLKLADGWIDVREIYRLHLRAQLVVLSACRSGFSEIAPGDEMMGLARGFLGAGASKLVVSQWDVDDAYAPKFMGQFYERLVQVNLDAVAALCAAQRHAIGEGYHPYWWAPFFVIG